MSKRIAVTGGDGFLGRALVRHLVDLGASVSTLVEEARASIAASSLPRDVRRVFGDIRDARALDALLERADAVVHLAGPPSVALSFLRPREYDSVHAGGTAELLQACKRCGVVTFVFASSAEVYGAVGALVNENRTANPRSPYGLAKLSAEKAIRRSAGPMLHATILRFFSVYGPGANEASLIPRIIRQAYSGGAVRVQDLGPIRDYCFVDDAARAIVRAVYTQGEECRTFNIGTGRGTSVRDLIELVGSISGRTLDVEEEPAQRRPSDIPFLTADISEAIRKLGWVPRTALEEGLRITMEDARARICASS